MSLDSILIVVALLVLVGLTTRVILVRLAVLCWSRSLVGFPEGCTVSTVDSVGVARVVLIDSGSRVTGIVADALVD